MRMRGVVICWWVGFSGCAWTKLQSRRLERGLTRRRVRPGRVARGKNDDDDQEEGLTAVDRFFEPLVEKFSQLDDKDQASLAFIYQGTYFMVCIYVGVILVRAYKVLRHVSPSMLAHLCSIPCRPRSVIGLSETAPFVTRVAIVMWHMFQPAHRRLCTEAASA